MSIWWTEQTGILIGSLGGAGLGTAGGLYGALAGLLAPRGIGKPFVLGTHAALWLAGLAALIAGVVAASTGQPAYVFYPLLLGGGIATIVLGGLWPVISVRYRQAEARRLQAEEIRRG